MARPASSYRGERRNRGWCRLPGLIAKKHQLQLAKRANQRALFAALTWAAPRSPMRRLYAKDRRFSQPSRFNAAQWLSKLLSPIASRHA